MLCEKCKKNGPKSMIKGKGGGQGKSKVDYAELFDEMVLKIPQTSFKPKKIQGWSPEKIIKDWDRINF